MRGRGWLAAAAVAVSMAVAAVTAAETAARAAGEAAGGVVYEGDDRATVRLSAPLAAAVGEYANAGYRLRRGPTGGEVTVEVSLAPLASTAPLVMPAVVADEVVVRAARAAVGDAKTVHQAVSRVLGWIVHHVGSEPGRGEGPSPREADGATEADRPAQAGQAPLEPTVVAGRRAAAEEVDRPASGGATTPPAPPPPWSSRSPAHPPSETPSGRAASATSTATSAEALARGAGDAAAVARLAAAMLRAVGVEARTVRGIVAGPPRAGAPRGPHVWIEVRYPDRGWAFSDPLHHHHYVPATYLRLSGDAAALASAAGGAELVARRDRRIAADVHPEGGPGIGARGNGEGQVAAALRVVVPGGGEGAAVLTDAAGAQRRLALLGGEGVFVGLAGGAYTLEVLLAGRPALSRALELPPRERSAVYFASGAAARHEEPSAAAAGEPRPTAGGRSGPARRRAPEER